jgi:hypothetical protein
MSINPSGAAVFPLPVNAKFIGIVSEACSIIFMCIGEGVQVVAKFTYILKNVVKNKNKK